MTSLPTLSRPPNANVERRLSEEEERTVRLRWHTYVQVFRKGITKQQPTRARALSFTWAHPMEPRDLSEIAAHSLSNFPLMSDPESILWLPNRGQAAYLLDDDADIRRLRLRDGSCELFWTSPAGTRHYVGRFKIVHGAYPYSMKQLDYYGPGREPGVDPELDLLAQFPGRPRTQNCKFVILQYSWWNTHLVDALKSTNFLRPLSDDERSDLGDSGILSALGE